MTFSDFRGFKISRLGLGTVQFGMDYGFTRAKSQGEVERILAEAEKEGINFLDTAPGYGDSEEKIGRCLRGSKAGAFRIATKIERVPADALVDAVKAEAHVRRSVEASTKRLSADRIFLLQTHQADDLELLSDGFWTAVRKLRREKLFDFFGVSVYDVEPTKNILLRYGDAIDFVQVPYNRLDERFWSLRNLLKEKGAGVAVRSAFARGVLSRGEPDPATPPAQAEKIRVELEALKKRALALDLSLSDYALAWVLSQGWVDTTLVGVDTPAELAADAAVLGRLERILPALRAEAASPRTAGGVEMDPRRWAGGPDVLCVLQARMSSSRLPGKVLLPILGQPMLLRQIERLRRASRVSRIVVATSSDPSDDPIEAACRTAGVDCFRGDLNDVLDRFYRAASDYGPRHVLRLTGDCPLVDPAIVDGLVEFYSKGGYDYASNTIPHSFPDGMDAEIFSMAALARAWKEARVPYEREHVTPYFYGNPELFKLGSYRSPEDLSSVRLTVDRAEDLDRVRSIYERLYPSKPDFSLKDILEASR